MSVASNLTETAQASIKAGEGGRDVGGGIEFLQLMHHTVTLQNLPNSK